MLENFGYFSDKDLSNDKQVYDTLINLQGEAFRQVKSRATLRININGQHYFIKKYFPVSFSEVLKNLINLKSPFSNAITEYNAICLVKILNIKTLDVIAYGHRKKMLQSTSFIITKAIEPNISLDKFAEQLKGHKYYYKFKRYLIDFIARTTRCLHLNGLNHRDYYLCHYLLNLAPEKVNEIVENFNCDRSFLTEDFLAKIYLIDLHRMQIRSNVPNRYLIKDLSAMLFSIRNLGLTRTDYIRFLQIYMGLTTKEKLKDFFTKEKHFLRKIQLKASTITEKG